MSSINGIINTHVVALCGGPDRAGILAQQHGIVVQCWESIALDDFDNPTGNPVFWPQTIDVTYENGVIRPTGKELVWGNVTGISAGAILGLKVGPQTALPLAWQYHNGWSVSSGTYTVEWPPTGLIDFSDILKYHRALEATGQLTGTTFGEAAANLVRIERELRI